MKLPTDESVLADIRGGGRARELALQLLYEAHLPMVIQFITQNSGMVRDAEDKFQEAITVFFEHVRDQVFQGRSSIKSYLMAIVRKMWYTDLKRRGLFQSFQSQQQVEEIELPDTPADILLSREAQAVLDQLLAELGEVCRQTLVWRFWESRPMKEIAKFLGFKNEQVAKNKQHNCMTRLRILITENPEAADILQRLL
jgi:RNA polymerase sigma factor (sigma-70 family)